jgi:hypothetical protein
MAPRDGAGSRHRAHDEGAGRGDALEHASSPIDQQSSSPQACICWHVPEPWHIEKQRRCNHRDQPKFSYGRCRSGKRWFWTVLEWFKPETYTDGWEDSEEAALAAARDAVSKLAGGQAAVAYLNHGIAYDRLKDINKAKRAARPAPDTSDTRTVEYLYTLIVRHPSMGPSENFKAFPIVRKTNKRIFYRRSGIRFWPEPESSESTFRRDTNNDIGYVNRQKIEADGYVYNHGHHWCEDDFHLCLRPPYLEPDEKPDLAQLKDEMAAAHPDRGGSNQAFIEARKRYVEARRAMRSGRGAP